MLNGHKGASCEMRRPRQFKILPFCTEAGQILCVPEADAAVVQIL